MTPYEQDLATGRFYGLILTPFIIAGVVLAIGWFLTRAAPAVDRRRRRRRYLIAAVIVFIVAALGAINAFVTRSENEFVEGLIDGTVQYCREHCDADQEQCATMCSCLRSGFVERMRSPETRRVVVQAARAGNRDAIATSLGDLGPRCAAEAGLELRR